MFVENYITLFACATFSSFGVRELQEHSFVNGDYATDLVDKFPKEDYHDLRDFMKRVMESFYLVRT